MRKGFTLMELMVALAAAGILVSVALGMYGSFYRGYVKSRDAYAAAASERSLQMQKSIREIRGCPNANRL
ncbi:type IV pilin protein [Fibrobacter succinogenes]|uniref:type IV pilin protein n=1 Tax=Fibrobacter succinogenes TaxID=833 RepID=UPI00156332C9|nr:prepilin-type N-terminal cleavage/methylation domain-containing protein [Fibrobacter succinogenes]